MSNTLTINMLTTCSLCNVHLCSDGKCLKCGQQIIVLGGNEVILRIDPDNTIPIGRPGTEAPSQKLEVYGTQEQDEEA